MTLALLWAENWRTQAACHRPDADLLERLAATLRDPPADPRQLVAQIFYPARGAQAPDGTFAPAAAAKALCATCPVKAQCLTVALTRGERYGIWGGLTEADRAVLRRNLDRAGHHYRHHRCAQCETIFLLARDATNTRYCSDGCYRDARRAQDDNRLRQSGASRAKRKKARAAA